MSVHSDLRIPLLPLSPLCVEQAVMETKERDWIETLNGSLVESPFVDSWFDGFVWGRV